MTNIFNSRYLTTVQCRTILLLICFLLCGALFMYFPIGWVVYIWNFVKLCSTCTFLPYSVSIIWMDYLIRRNDIIISIELNSNKNCVQWAYLIKVLVWLISSPSKLQEINFNSAIEPRLVLLLTATKNKVTVLQWLIR